MHFFRYFTLCRLNETLHTSEWCGGRDADFLVGCKLQQFWFTYSRGIFPVLCKQPYVCEVLFYTEVDHRKLWNYLSCPCSLIEGFASVIVLYCLGFFGVIFSCALFHFVFIICMSNLKSSVVLCCVFSSSHLLFRWNHSRHVTFSTFEIISLIVDLCAYM